MPVRISEKKPVLFNVSKPSRYKAPTSQAVQSSSTGGIQLESKERITKQILGQGDYKGESHTLNDPRNSIDRSAQIDNWSLAFNGIQHMSSAYGKEHKKNHVPNEGNYSAHFSL